MIEIQGTNIIILLQNPIVLQLIGQLTGTQNVACSSALFNNPNVKLMMD